MSDLNVTDFFGVPILSAGGPYHGTGSPPEGDFFTEADLTALADANNSHAAEIQAPLKVGHSKEQKLLKNSGLSLDEKPAAGWLSNYRVDGGKLLVDVTGVPAKLAALWKSGAFARRSAEIGKLTSQQTGKSVTAITGLALLGAKAPAIRTLDDMLATYAADQGIETTETTEVLLADDKPGDDVNAVEFTDEMADETDDQYTVSYAATQIADSIIRSFTTTSANTAGATWRWTFGATPMKEDQMDDQMKRSGDDTSTMKLTDLTDAQVLTLAETFGIEEDDEAKRREAVTQTMTGLALPEEPKPDPAEEKDDQQITPGVTLSESDVADLKRDAALGKQAYESQKAGEREGVLRKAVEDGKLAPAALDHWRSFYDADSESCVATIETLAVDDNLLRALGEDGEGEGEGSEAAEEAEYRAYASALGIPVPEEGR